MFNIQIHKEYNWNSKICVILTFANEDIELIELINEYFKEEKFKRTKAIFPIYIAEFECRGCQLGTFAKFVYSLNWKYKEEVQLLFKTENNYIFDYINIGSNLDAFQSYWG